MSRKTITKIEKTFILFFNACGYKEVSYLLLNNPNGLGTDCNFFSACIVNGMLAIELYLKFLNAYDYAVKNKTATTEFTNVHDINALYKQLSISRRKELLDELLKLGCNKETFTKFRAKIRSAEKNKQNNKGKNWDVVNWRYLIVDGKNTYRFDLDTMTKLNESLYRISQRIINTPGNNIQFPSMSSPALDTVSANITNKLYITPFKPE
jgi:hypothetical protein